jgi:hypothetical protein
MPRLRKQELEWREADGEIVILDLATSTYFAVNQSGALLWPSIVEGADRAQLCAKLVLEHDLNARQAEIDVDRFLDVLHERGLLEE